MVRKLRHYIREWRDYRGLSQAQLGERIDRSFSAISRIETGSSLTQVTLEALAEALGVDDPRDLLYPPPNAPEADVEDLMVRLNPRKRHEAALALQRILNRGDDLATRKKRA